MFFILHYRSLIAIVYALFCHKLYKNILYFVDFFADCGLPVSIADASVSYPATVYPNDATYSCDHHYNCIYITDCGLPVSIADASVSYPATVYPNDATYSCNHHYTSSNTGGMVINCNSSGLWTSSSFQCDYGIFQPFLWLQYSHQGINFLNVTTPSTFMIAAFRLDTQSLSLVAITSQAGDVHSSRVLVSKEHVLVMSSTVI